MGNNMGMKNLILAAELQPRIMRETRGLLSPNTHAFSTLITMARHTYDWEPTARQRINHVPCRLYERGIMFIADSQGYGKLSAKESLEAAGKPGEKSRIQCKRLESGAEAASKDVRFLIECGFVKQLRPQRLGRNASYLLLLGDSEENRLVEDWAWECIEAGWKR